MKYIYVVLAVVAGFFIVSQKAISETEQTTTYDYGSGTFSTETINRDNGNVNSTRYDYGTGTFSTYQGDENGGTSYDYGTGTFKGVDGDPYGVGD